MLDNAYAATPAATARPWMSKDVIAVHDMAVPAAERRTIAPFSVTDHGTAVSVAGFPTGGTDVQFWDPDAWSPPF